MPRRIVAGDSSRGRGESLSGASLSGCSPLTSTDTSPGSSVCSTIRRFSATERRTRTRRNDTPNSSIPTASGHQQDHARGEDDTLTQVPRLVGVHSGSRARGIADTASPPVGLAAPDATAPTRSPFAAAGLTTQLCSRRVAVLHRRSDPRHGFAPTCSLGVSMEGRVAAEDTDGNSCCVPRKLTARISKEDHRSFGLLWRKSALDSAQDDTSMIQLGSQLQRTSQRTSETGGWGVFASGRRISRLPMRLSVALRTEMRSEAAASGMFTIWMTS